MSMEVIRTNNLYATSFGYYLKYFRITRWKWTHQGCELLEDRGYEGVCACSVSGIFAITTDMYNVNVSLNINIFS